MSFVDTFFNSDVMISAFPQLLRGLWMTIALGVVSIVIGVSAGLIVSLIRLYAPKPLQMLMIAYIDIMRAMPMLVVLILIYYALPFVGISFSAWWSAILGFSIVLAAYSAEVFRSGIESVPRGQFEAAAALGIPFLITLYKVVLPQAVRIVIPPTTSNCVSMFKDTSLASTVALPELLKEGQNAQGFYANPSPLIMAALIYIILLWPMVRLVSVLEKRFKSERAR
ncbi:MULTISPECIES: amino acid ABC transporter permease [Rhizobium]|jgi:polar amino acid transport system permease protein|uniref:Polar amino acid transport system permease protein n=1 Tax=Rhizobium lusitanum TaxID=293958 RepID=A0A1C3UQL4_9HYPH|nr:MULTISPECIES: amino acid ABC transporter permease [Rhizobium]NRP86564.1 L-cystine transport system permease protein YecS [Ensifer adhaerens]NKJ03560.1 polar amino acid transport system permease protein [Rhizobium sp. SG741]NKJ33694.1 polar amino acid transport system permease protein [Rhizobium sp. SG570]NTJ08063.1 amino acid ABC transporter permease [Rhizobium lusitanum]SCB17766.1 polar amino acid transport system permease protein [Rhizobium lusitanum]